MEIDEESFERERAKLEEPCLPDKAFRVRGFDAGYYWLKSNWTGERTLAKFDGGDSNSWSFHGSTYLLDTNEVFGRSSGDHETFTFLGLGPTLK